MVVVVTSGCGGGGDDRTAAEAASVNSATTTTTTSAPAGDVTSTTTKAGAKPASGAGPSTTAPGSASASGGADTTAVTFAPPDYKIHVRFATACLRAGRQQTIFVDMGRKGVLVYNAVYSDKNNASQPNYYGGNDGGNTDAAGKYQDSWVVGAAAAPGPVEVTVLGIDGQRKKGEGVGHFSVADAQGKCA